MPGDWINRVLMIGGVVLAAVTVGVVFSLPPTRAPAADGAGPPYAFVPGGDGARLWRANTLTGEVSVCTPTQQVDAAPRYSPWTGRSTGGAS